MTSPLSPEEHAEAVARQSEPNCVAIFSGGMDSTVLVHKLLAEGHTPHLVSFNYGQRHVKELHCATNTALKLGLKHDVVDLTGLTRLISNSALTSPRIKFGQAVDEIEVPEGHYAEDNMKKTVVPNRNMIMLSIAAGIAVNNGYDFVATGVHAGDHFVYPDCRPNFIRAANAAIVYGNEGFGSIPKHEDCQMAIDFVVAPFLCWPKEAIAYEGFKLDVPFEDTWSCYKGGEKHCGKCGTCVERLEAIHEAAQRHMRSGEPDKVRINPANGFPDFTHYEDTTFWKDAIASAKK
jgi:7-cyano-7-deazaguanine synthase